MADKLPPELWLRILGYLVPTYGHLGAVWNEGFMHPTYPGVDYEDMVLRHEENDVEDEPWANFIPFETLANVGLVSRSLNNLARPLLLTTVTLDADCIFDFLQVLVRSPDLGLHVRVLGLDSDGATHDAWTEDFVDIAGDLLVKAKNAPLSSTSFATRTISWLEGEFNHCAEQTMHEPINHGTPTLDIGASLCLILMPNIEDLLVHVDWSCQEPMYFLAKLIVDAALWPLQANTIDSSTPAPRIPRTYASHDEVPSLLSRLTCFRNRHANFELSTLHSGFMPIFYLPSLRVLDIGVAACEVGDSGGNENPDPVDYGHRWKAFALERMRQGYLRDRFEKLEMGTHGDGVGRGSGIGGGVGRTTGTDSTLPYWSDYFTWRAHRKQEHPMIASLLRRWEDRSQLTKVVLYEIMADEPQGLVSVLEQFPRVEELYVTLTSARFCVEWTTHGLEAAGDVLRGLCRKPPWPVPLAKWVRKTDRDGTEYLPGSCLKRVRFDYSWRQGECLGYGFGSHKGLEHMDIKYTV